MECRAGERRNREWRSLWREARHGSSLQEQHRSVPTLGLQAAGRTAGRPWRQEFKDKFRAVVFAILEGRGSARHPIEEKGKFAPFYATFGRWTKVQ